VSVAPLDEAPGFSREPGTEPIPGYRLLAPLGQGGFGEVWKCEAPGGLLKAIKFVHGGHHSLDDSTPAEEELRAIQRIKSVRHPFILSIERVEVARGQLVIVFELADRSLADVLRAEQAAGRAGIARGRLLGYLREAAEALDLLNFQHQLQHLDVKPQNLFLVSNHVKVGDFGLVQSLALHGGGAQAPVGTPLYAAPEVLQGVIGAHADQYSLAIVYQELLTATLPFRAKNVRQMLMQHLQAEPDLRALPAGDRPLLARALAKDPARRFPSCSDFIHALTTGQTELVPALSPSSRSSPGTALRATPSGPGAGSDDGLHFRFSTTLPAHLIRMRLGGFRSQWQARVVRSDAAGFDLRLQAPSSFWQRWQGPQPEVEVQLRIVPISDPSGSGIDVGASVHLAIRLCAGAGPAELLGGVGPLLAESVRSHLQFNQRRRAQERLVWQHPLQLRPFLPDGSLGPAVECRGKDLSLGGIGFYLQGEVPGRHVMLHLPQTALTAAVAVPARIVRAQACGEGWQEVGAVLDPPHELPAEEGDCDEWEGEETPPVRGKPTPRPAFPSTPESPLVEAASPRPLAKGAVWLVGAAAGVAAVIVGLVAGARLRPAAEAQSRPVAEVPAAPGRLIRVEGLEAEFTDLESAVAAAPDGGVIRLHGRQRTRPLRVRGKALTIRGDPGSMPLLERVEEDQPSWEALVSSDRPLLLEGLRLRGRPDDRAPLVSVERASLTLRDCLLEMPAPAPAVALRQGEQLRVVRCAIEARHQALAVEVAGGPCRVELRRTRAKVFEERGAMLLAWSPESAPASRVEIDLLSSHVRCGRVLVCRRVLGPVVVTAKGSRLQARESRVSFAGYGSRPAAEVLTWRELKEDAGGGASSAGSE
jgi:serine/threonine protein kinase